MIATPQENHIVLGSLLAEIKASIMYRLLTDDTVCKLLYYDTPDALSKNMTDRQKQHLFLSKGDTKYRRIYLKPFPNQVTSTKDCELRIHLADLNVENKYTYKPYIQIDVLCHNDITDLDDGLNQRQDVLISRINDLLENYQIEKLVGEMHLQNISEWTMHDSAYLGYTMLFSAGTVNM